MCSREGNGNREKSEDLPEQINKSKLSGKKAEFSFLLSCLLKIFDCLIMMV